MIDITPHLNLTYKILGQQPGADAAATVMRGAPSSAPAAQPAFVGPFDNMNAGDTRTFRSFQANQVGDPSKGGVTVIGGTGSAAGAFDTYRTQGLTPEQAAAAVNATYGADLTAQKTRLMPTESAATTALTNAQAANTNVNTQWLPKLNEAQIAESGSRVGLNKASTSKTYAETSAVNEDTASNRIGLNYLGLLGPDALPQWRKSPK